MLENFETDINTCGIYKKKRFDNYIKYKFDINKMLVDTIKEEEFN